MGVQIQGDTGNVIATKGTYSGNVTIGGTLTYEDVTNIDSVGLVTAREGIEVGARPGVAASISVDGNAIFSGITTIGGNVKVGTGVTLSPDGDIFATGVTTSTTFVGDLTGTATNANHVSVADNESTNENNLIPFIEDASATGNVGLESDGDFTYNPSTGTVTATQFVGGGAGLTGVSAGKFVGFGLQTHTTEQYVQQSSYQLVGTALTYTATSASNKLLILHNHSLLIEDSQFWNMALYRDGLSGTQLYERKSYSQDAQWIPTQGINSVVVDIPDTSSHTYQFAMYRSGGTNRTVYNYHGGSVSGGVVQIILFEFDPS